MLFNRIVKGKNIFRGGGGKLVFGEGGINWYLWSGKYQDFLSPCVWNLQMLFYYYYIYLGGGGGFD